MNLTIKNLTQEQYKKILNFADSITEKKHFLTIFREDGDNFDTEISACFDREEIEDIKIINNLKNYQLCNKYEGNYDKEELQKEGYNLFYLEATIHSGIWLYEFSGALRDKWDSGIAGIIAIKGDAKVGYEAFKDFIKVWQKYADGDFYGYTITDRFGDDIDCCGGFWSIEELKEALPDYITEEQIKEAIKNIRY